jgi:hypothetical protein
MRSIRLRKIRLGEARLSAFAAACAALGAKNHLSYGPLDYGGGYLGGDDLGDILIVFAATPSRPVALSIVAFEAVTSDVPLIPEIRPEDFEKLCDLLGARTVSERGTIARIWLMQDRM